MADEWRRAGVPESAISTPGGELAGAREALEWARAGDLVVLALHQERRKVEELLRALRERGWKAGDALERER
jgi:hypothetical protein